MSRWPGAGVLLAGGIAALLGAGPAQALPWNVGDIDRPGQWTIYNRIASGAGIGLPVGCGDVNGDGRADVVLTPMNADSGPNHERMRSGEAAIVLGPGTPAGFTDLAVVDAAAPPADVVLLFGAHPLDLFGTQVVVADVDGDGFADTIVGAQNADGPDQTRSGAGEVVILWGSAGLGGQAIDLADLPRPDVTRITGAHPGDRLGVWVGSGDFDGDGIRDLLLGADQVTPPDSARTHAGAVYVLYGGSALRAQRDVDLATPGLPATTVYGVDAEDHCGSTVRGVDLDGDGAAELLIGAGLSRLSALVDQVGEPTAHGKAGGDGPAGDRPEAGEAYVVYGQRGSRPLGVDLATPPASTVIIYGAQAGDAWGEEIDAGDFNGDGRGDLVVGALTAHGREGATNAGATALILGGPSLPGSRIDLAAPGDNVSIFLGAEPGAISGDTVFLVDIDGDRRDELFIASPAASPGKRGRAGEVDVILGTAEPLPRLLDLSALPASLAHLRIEGGQAADILGYSGALGDVDADGVEDVVFNGMGGDGFEDLLPAAGEAYVLSGAGLAAALGANATQTPSPSATETPSPTPPPSPTATSFPSATATIPPTATSTPTATASPSQTATATTSSSSGGGCSVDPRGGGLPSPLWIGLLVLARHFLRRHS